MTRRLVSLLLALVTALGLAVSVAPPAAADIGLDDVIEGGCVLAAGPAAGGAMLAHKFDVPLVGDLPGGDLCEKVGDSGAEAVKEAWQAVKDSALGPVIESLTDVTKWVIEKVLTIALIGPSVDLEATGLFGRDATLAGMMMWLGLVIAAGGVIWQVGKMAVTGQAKHLGRAAVGWGENLLLSTIGVAMFAMMLKLGDALTTGLVHETFDKNKEAYWRVMDTLLPVGVQNPMTVLGIVVVLLLVGFIQLVVIFLRQSAIPFIALLMPVAAAGRAGGDATRQWAPKLITSALVIITYKPILAIIICVGFSEFGSSQTLAEWLRGVATLVLGVLAPGPLTKIFAPFGNAVGSGMSAGGAGGAIGAAADFLGSKFGGGGEGGEGAPPATPMSHAQMVAKNMGDNPDDPGPPGPGPDDPPDDPDKGPDREGLRNHSQRNDNTPPIPEQPTGDMDGGLVNGAVKGGAMGPAGVAIEVLDGVNDAIQAAADEMGGEDRNDDA